MEARRGQPGIFFDGCKYLSNIGFESHIVNIKIEAVYCPQIFDYIKITAKQIGTFGTWKYLYFVYFTALIS